MKRKILVTLMVFYMMISMVACGNGATASINENTATESNEEKESEIEEETDSEREETRADDEPSVSEKETDSKLEEMQTDDEPDASEKDADSKIDTTDVGLDGLEEVVMADVEGTIATLTKEYEALLAEMDTYETYVENTDTMEDFYEKVYGETRDICIRLREYCVTYANVILESDKSFDEKYEDFEVMYDCVYEDAADEVYDQIYEGILDEVYDEIYEGLLDDARENAEYAEWLDARSNEYEWWLDCRSDVYEEWLDCRSEIYEFWLDVRGEMWDDDEERAYEKIEDFVDDIEKLKSKSGE